MPKWRRKLPNEQKGDLISLTVPMYTFSAYPLNTPSKHTRIGQTNVLMLVPHDMLYRPNLFSYHCHYCIPTQHNRFGGAEATEGTEAAAEAAAEA